MANKIQIRRDTTANWTASNPILSQGELGLDTTLNKMKIGNGTSQWSALSFFIGDTGATGATGATGPQGNVGPAGVTELSELVNGTAILSLDATGDLTLADNGGIVFDRAHTSIRVGMGFHIASGEGISLEAIDETDPNNLITKGWYFSPSGGITFPTLSVDIHNGGVQSAQVLKFDDATKQVIITGPSPAAGNSAERIIIQGQRATGNGEGGDVYLWGGDSAINGGDIKIYAGDADSDVIGAVGGYVNIDAGNGFSSGGNLTLSAGVARGGENSYGGNVSITAGHADNGTSGNIQLNTYAQSWTFTNDSKLTLPGNAKIANPDNTLVTTGLRINVTGSEYNASTGGIDLQLADPAIGALINANPSFYSFRFASGAALGVTLPGAFVAVGTPAPGSTWRSEGWGIDTPNISSAFSLFSSDYVDPYTAPGYLRLSSDTGVDWTFGKDGKLTLPDGGVIAESGGLTGAIKLTPAGGANAYQALVIYPTAALDGDHIHLTAGGGSTELYLGNDTHYVKLVNGGDVAVQASTADLSSTAAWTFDTVGNIDAQQALGIKVPDGVPSSVTAITTTTASWELNPMSNLATTGGSGTGLTVNITQTDGYVSAIAIATAGTGYNNGDYITVVSGSSTAYFTIAVAGRNSWLFGLDGTLTLPDASVIASYKPVTVIAATSTTQTITESASASIIQFVETVDTAGAFTPGTFTAPYTGYYQVNLSVYFSTPVGLVSGSFLIIDNNLDNTKQVTIFNGDWTGSYIHYSTVIPASAGDAIRVVFRQVGGGPSIDIASGSRLTIHRVSIS